MLIATWCFGIANLPFTVFGIYAIAVEPKKYTGYLYLFGSFVAFAALGVWILGCKSPSPSFSWPF
jgi:hypothetical protein